jgi:cysteine-S-conjugate beta-lyase
MISTAITFLSLSQTFATMKYFKTVEPFESISLDRLRKRKSEKWSTYSRGVLPAFVAEMDFDLALPIRAALVEAVELGDAGYSSSTEVPASFASSVRNRFDWSTDESAVFAVPDVMAGVAEAIQLLTPPGASIVINPPVYPPFFDVIAHEGRTVLEVPLQAHDRMWSVNLDTLEGAFADGARAYLLCNPHNPVGRVWSERELHDIVSLASRYGVPIISDEIYAPLTMPGLSFIPVCKITEDQPCIALWSASKAFNISGLKCAAMIASAQVREALRARLRARPDEIESRIGHLGVIATIAAFRNGAAWLDDLRVYLDGNRHLLADLLRDQIPAARYSLPEATYLAWIDCSELPLKGAPARQFLERGLVALEAGHKFGRLSSNWVRLNFGTSRVLLREIVQRMAAALA